jgi:4-amino-4-deoxy-L-arabinose transferase-like glycosyltransferase
VIVPSSLWFLDRVPSAEIDMVQVAWVVGSLFCFCRAVEISENSEKPHWSVWGWWIGALLCVSGGVLTKWTAPLFFYGTAIPYLWWRGRLRLLFAGPHLLGVVVGATIVLDWIGAVVWCVGSERLFDTICQEALPKFLPGQRDRGYPWLEIVLLPLRLMAGNLPWSAFALLTLVPSVSRNWSDAAKRLLQLFHCWLWPNLLFWSLVPNHAPRHSLPLVPALAGLATLVWIAFFNGQLRWRVRLFPAAAMLLGIIVMFLIAKVVFVHTRFAERTAERQPKEKGELLAQLVPVGQTLHLFAVKDEGMMFYYGRPVQRLDDPSLLPASDELLYCIITESEWRRFRETTVCEMVQTLTDEQGDGLVLVQMRHQREPMNRTDKSKR